MTMTFNQIIFVFHLLALPAYVSRLGLIRNQFWHLSCIPSKT